MSIFSKSTREIVAKGRPKEELNTIVEAVGAEIPSAQIQQSETVNPIVYYLLIGIAVFAAIIAATLLYILLAPSDPILMPVVADNQAVMAVYADKAILRSTTHGDIVRLYDPNGTPVKELQYVQVYQSNKDSLLLIVDDAQAQTLVKIKEPQVALVVSGDAIRAAELIKYQACINHPTIKFTLQQHIVIDINADPALEWTASIEPAELSIPDVVWTSDNTGIVTVENGVLHPLTEGEAMITAVCGNVTASCKVTVVIDSKSALLVTDKVTLAVRETAQLAAAGPISTDHIDVMWNVADPSIATVDENGVLTAVSPGKTVVTASCSEISAACEITVGYHADVVQLDKQELKLVTSHKGKLTPAIYPDDNVIDEGRWEVENPLIATVDKDGNVLALIAGETRVTYICGNAKASCIVKVYAFAIPEDEQ